MERRKLSASRYQKQVSILRPVGYGPTTLPLRHSDAMRCAGGDCHYRMSAPQAYLKPTLSPRMRAAPRPASTPFCMRAMEEWMRILFYLGSNCDSALEGAPPAHGLPRAGPSGKAQRRDIEGASEGSAAQCGREGSLARLARPSTPPSTQLRLSPSTGGKRAAGPPLGGAARAHDARVRRGGCRARSGYAGLQPRRAGPRHRQRGGRASVPPRLARAHAPWVL
eukprot:scaffold1248_cov393-Prasinococcus_capsulatus_cf.AAC.8